MTTIAYRDGIMAADTMMSRGSEKAFGAVKIFATKKYLVGISGAFVAMTPVKDLITEHEETFPEPSQMWREWDEIPQYGNGYCALLVGRDGRIWNAIDGPPVLVPTEFDAIGSGGTYAMGAMGAGLSAADAVRVARRFDANTGGNVIRLNLTQIGTNCEAR